MTYQEDYAAGFAEGELLRFQDRAKGCVRARPQNMRSERMRGFWDGYTPRSIGWALNSKRLVDNFADEVIA